jgi:hypothetical protein
MYSNLRGDCMSCLKNIIALAAHGSPATDYSRGKIGMFMALESMPGFVRRAGV